MSLLDGYWVPMPVRVRWWRVTFHVRKAYFDLQRHGFKRWIENRWWEWKFQRRLKRREDENETHNNH